MSKPSSLPLKNFGKPSKTLIIQKGLALQPAPQIRPSNQTLTNNPQKLGAKNE